MKTKKVLKFVMGVFAVLMLFAAFRTDVYAEGTLTLSADKTSAVIGETVNVTVQASEPEDPSVPPEVSVTYNSDILEYAGANVEIGGGGGLITFSGLSATLTFTALQTGNVNIAAEALIDEVTVLGNTMVTVGANGGAGLSSDATLHVLQMDPGQLVPEFSSDVTEYQIVIGNDVTDITVSGAVSDPTAQITAASGFKNLKEGTNQAVITVTAADGTMLTYHFTIVRGEATVTEETEETSTEQEEEETSENKQTGAGLNVTLDGTAYTVQSVIPEEIVPEGCTKTTSAFNGKPVEAALFEKGGLTLLYALKTGSEEGDFFVYNEASGKLHLFVQIFNIENRYIVPIEAQNAPPAYFKEGEISWNEFRIPAFVLTDTSVENADVFYLLYAVSNEGERGFYLYDTVEGTYQRFLNYSGAKTAASVAVMGEGFSKKSILVIAILAILLVVAVMLIVNMIIKNKEIQEDTIYEKKALKKPEPKPLKKPEPKPVKKSEPKQTERKQQPKPSVKKTVVPQPEKVEELIADELIADEPKKTVAKPEVKPEPKSEPKSVQKAENISKKVDSKPQAPIQPMIRQRPVIHTDHVVTMQPRQVDGTVSITGEIPQNIPVKVVPTPKSEVRRPSVPIFTLEKPSELDDDFEFEFINIDND